jgi:hypothetical protein
MIHLEIMRVPAARIEEIRWWNAGNVVGSIQVYTAQKRLFVPVPSSGDQ